MKYGIICVAAFLGCGLSFWVIRSRFNRGGNGEAGAQDGAFDPKNVMLATSTQSDERAARLLPTKGSEDASHLLVRPKHHASFEGEVGPQESIEWVIDLSPAHEEIVLTRAKILGAFDSEALSKERLVQVYGRSPATKRWVYVKAADAPDEYGELSFGVELKSPSEPPTEVELELIASKIQAAADRIGVFVAKQRSSAAVAVRRAKELDVLASEFEDAKAVILLAAPEGTTFDGKLIWDVMLCLGLHWGDMDEFHWENEERSFGDDHLFSVSSSTAPGYFLPEQVAAGSLHLGNLVFDFSIPRSSDPEAVVEGMLAAATYAQKRLGGVLVDGEGEDLKPDALRKHVAELAGRLRKAGLVPGDTATLKLF